MEKQAFEHLVQKFLDETIGQEELAVFLAEVQKEPGLAVIDDVLRARLENKMDRGLSDPGQLPEMFSEVLKRSGEAPQTPVVAMPVKRSFTFKRIAAAAVLTGLVLGGLYYFNTGNRAKDTGALQSGAAAIIKDVQPGGNKAILTLADGSTITLDSAKNGQLSRQGNTSIIKLNNGQLAYQAKGQAGAVVYNTISTPRGGTYKIILPDNTTVWLNAGSSVRFPTAFTGSERNVQITGEAYFEVSKHTGADGRNVPFIVHVNDAAAGGGMQVEVLGTHFNIMAYDDESVVKTTLLEGAVKVTKSNNSVLLSPMQQARLVKQNSDLKVTNSINADEETAWINGVFQYNDTELPAIMRQLSRWYDVEVSYEGPIPTDRFTGKISKNISLTQVLKILELSDLHFKIEGRKIIVTA